jgi:hypothetical protein
MITLFDVDYDVDVQEWTVLELRNCRVDVFVYGISYDAQDWAVITHIPTGAKKTVIDTSPNVDDTFERAIEEVIKNLNYEEGLHDSK